MKNLYPLIFFTFMMPAVSMYAQCTSGCNITHSTCTNLAGPTTVASGSAGSYNVYCISPPAGCGNITIGDFILDQYSTVRICTNSPTDTVKFIGQFRASGGGSAGAHDNTRRFEVQGNVQMTYQGTITFNSRIVINVASTGTLDLRPTGPAGSNPLLIANSDSIINAGKILSDGPISFAGTVSNRSTGSITATSITVSSGILNNGTMTSQQNITLSSGANVINNGSITSTGSFTSSAGSFFDNNNYWHAMGNATFSGSYANNSYFLSDGILTLNASGTLNVQNGMFESDTLILNAGNLNTGSGCAVFKVNKYSSIQNGSGISATPAGSVGIWDTGNPGQIDNVACGCGSSDADGVDNSITMPSGTQCSAPAAPNASGPYCGIIPITSTSAAGGCFTAMPVKFISVSVKGSNTSNIVRWTVEEAETNLVYEVQYSADGNSFQPAGFVQPHRGDLISDYSYTHTNNLLHGLYYRVKQVDNDGKNYFSKVVYFDASAENSVYLFPNPANDQFTVYSGNEITSVELLMANGQLIGTYNVSVNKTIDISSLDKGVYFVRSYFNDGINYTKLVRQ